MDTDQGNGVDQAPADQQPHKPRRVVLPSVFIAMCALLVVAAGFVAFWEKSAQMKWQDNVTGDGIVVLTGGPERISRAIDFLQQNSAGRLLISGVHPATTARQLGRIMGVQARPVQMLHRPRQEAADTRGNATEAAVWAE
jgi:uncharacterized SAM-binding protein YcdF (DUF218 family)